MLWLDIEGPDKSERAVWLERLGVEGLALRLCLDVGDRPGLYPLKEEIVLVIPMLPEAMDKPQVQHLTCLCREGLLLTLHERNLVTDDRLAEIAYADAWLSDRSIHALLSAALIDLSTDDLRPAGMLRSLTLWHADERESLGAKSGWGAVVSLTRTLGERWIAFARAGYANRGAGLLERSVSVGGSYALSGTDNAPGSQVGFAANWGRPNDALFGSGLDDQYGLEAYLRLQVTRELAVTPSVQLLVDAALDPDTGTTWVFGLRTRLAF